MIEGAIGEWTDVVRRCALPDDDAAMIDEIRALEELKCAASARQARLSAAFDRSQRAEQARRGTPAALQGRGVAAQIALARRESHHRGQQHLGLATALESDLPSTQAAFDGGHISEWRATLVARETSCLSRHDRRAVDARIAEDPAALAAMGDRELVGRLRELAYEIDAQAFVQRRARAESERRVTCRPAPDVMTHLSALLPVEQGVAVYAVLRGEADRLRGVGDPRSRGQIMAGTLHDRVVGPAAGRRGSVGVVINVVVPDDVLLGVGDGAAHVEGYGPVPGDVARELATSSDLLVALRRLYAAPRTGQVVAMDSRTTSFPKSLATFIRLRDQACRTPWCDAPIRHTDHVESLAEGGPTSGPNGQGLCEACNHAKQALGWSARPRPGPRHTVETRTPTGHAYRSTTPGRARGITASRAEVAFSRLVLVG